MYPSDSLRRAHTRKSKATRQSTTNLEGQAAAPRGTRSHEVCVRELGATLHKRVGQDRKMLERSKTMNLVSH